MYTSKRDAQRAPFVVKAVKVERAARAIPSDCLRRFVRGDHHPEAFRCGGLDGIRG